MIAFDVLIPVDMTFVSIELHIENVLLEPGKT